MSGTGCGQLYGRGPSGDAIAFRHHTTKELERDLRSPSIDKDTAERIKAELARRVLRRFEKRHGLKPNTVRT
jgi:hypothetical protein